MAGKTKSKADNVDITKELLGASGMHNRFRIYAYRQEVMAAMSEEGDATKWQFLSAFCEAMVRARNGYMQRPCLRTCEGRVTGWDICEGPGETATSGHHLYNMAGATRAFLESFACAERDTAASTLMLLPDIMHLWWSEDAKTRIGMEYNSSEQYLRAVAHAWLQCGGQAAIGEEAPGWVGGMADG